MKVDLFCREARLQSGVELAARHYVKVQPLLRYDLAHRQAQKGLTGIRHPIAVARKAGDIALAIVPDNGLVIANQGCAMRFRELTCIAPPNLQTLGKTLGT